MPEVTVSLSARLINREGYTLKLSGHVCADLFQVEEIMYHFLTYD